MHHAWNFQKSQTLSEILEIQNGT